MNHATICVIKNQIRHPFSQYNKSMQDIPTYISSSFLIYKIIVVVSKQKSNQNKNKQKDAPSLCDKVFQMKNRSYTCANQEYVGSLGMFSTSTSLWFSPSMYNSWRISSNPCEKTSKHCFYHFFLWGDISRDKQIGFLLHIIHGPKYI